MNGRRIQLQQRSKGAKQQPTGLDDVQEWIEDEEYDDIWPPRMPSSARRYQGLADVQAEVGRTPSDVQVLASQRTYRVNNTRGKTPVPYRRTTAQEDSPGLTRKPRRDPQTDEVNISPDDEALQRGERARMHWLVFVGMAMFTMLVGWVFLSMLANWWQVTQDDWHYGRPRTYQTDALVGHNDSVINPSHFVALNLNRHIQIIEFPGGDSSKAKIYLGPTLVGPGQDLAVVTLTFKDVNGDGKLDMIVNVEDSHIVFINDNSEFRPLRAGENVQL